MKFRCEKGVAAIDIPLLIGFACATLTIACPEQAQSITCVFEKSGSGMDSVATIQVLNNLPIGYNETRCGVPTWTTKPPSPTYSKTGGGSGSGV